MDTNYNNLDLNYLDPEDLYAIELKAKALTLEDCYDYLHIDPEHLPEHEAVYAQKAWRRGRMSSIATAAEKLFSSMNGRNGGTFALEYLKALSSTFQIEPTPGATPGGFSFNVIMPEDQVGSKKTKSKSNSNPNSNPNSNANTNIKSIK